MHCLDVVFENTAAHCLIWTWGTGEVPNFLMYAVYMFLHVTFHREHFPAFFTLVWFWFVMDWHHMSIQIRFLTKCLGTLLTIWCFRHSYTTGWHSVFPARTDNTQQMNFLAHQLMIINKPGHSLQLLRIRRGIQKQIKYSLNLTDSVLPFL